MKFQTSLGRNHTFMWRAHCVCIHTGSLDRLIAPVHALWRHNRLHKLCRSFVADWIASPYSVFRATNQIRLNGTETMRIRSILFQFLCDRCFFHSRANHVTSLAQHTDIDYQMDLAYGACMKFFFHRSWKIWSVRAIGVWGRSPLVWEFRSLIVFWHIFWNVGTTNYRNDVMNFFSNRPSITLNRAFGLSSTFSGMLEYRACTEQQHLCRQIFSRGTTTSCAPFTLNSSFDDGKQPKQTASHNFG